MIVPIVLGGIALLAVLAVVLIRRAGGGRFPWLQFFLRGRESGFSMREINLIRRVAVEARLEDPTALFWSVKQLDRSIKAFIIRFRSHGEEQDPAYHGLLGKLFELRKRVEFAQPKYKLGIKSSRKLPKHQKVRITLPGSGPFQSIMVENLPRYMAFSRPQGPKLPDGFSWKDQTIGVYFWRNEDAGYYFQTKVIEDYIERKVPIIHVAHSDKLIRTQKRGEVRTETDLPAELFPLRAVGEGSEDPESARGLRCRVVDLSEGGLGLLIGGKAKIGLPVKVQFNLGDSPIVMSGVVKGINYDQAKNRSLLHVQAAPPSVATRNRINIYVFNLFGERAVAQPARPAEAAGATADAASGESRGAGSADRAKGDEREGKAGRATPAGEAEGKPTVELG